MPLLVNDTLLLVHVGGPGPQLQHVLEEAATPRRQPGVDNVRHGEHLLGQLQLPVKLGP